MLKKSNQQITFFNKYNSRVKKLNSIIYPSGITVVQNVVLLGASKYILINYLMSFASKQAN